MELGELTRLVGEAHAASSCVAPTRRQLEVSLAAIARVRGVLDGLEVEAVRKLAGLCSDPESVVAGATRASAREAARVVERVGALDALPELAASLAEGKTSAAHVDALGRAMRRLEPDERARLASRAGFLAGVAERVSAEQFARTVQAESARLAGDAQARLERQRRAASLRTWVEQESGMWSGRFEFDPATGLRLDAVLNAAVAALFAETVPDTAPSDPVARQQHLRALALARLLLGGPVGDGDCEAGGADRRASGVRAEVVVVVDLDREGHTGADAADDADADADAVAVDWGLPVELPLSVLRELCANAVINPIVVRNGVVVGGVGRLNLGRESRLANRAQRRALRVMYPTCPMPGCEVRYAFTKPHHVVWWRHGGLTDLDNLLPVCSRHHHAIHDLGWQVKLLGDRTLVVTLPDGTVRRTGPPRNRSG